MKTLTLILILLFASPCYAEIRGTNIGYLNTRYLSKVSNDITTYELDVRSNLSADSISTDAISADSLYLRGYSFPTDAPADNDVIKWDTALGRLNYEADATGAGGAGIPGIGNQFEITYWGNTDASISGDAGLTYNPTTDVLTTPVISILSNDAVIQDTKLTILSSDAVLQDTKLAILTSDAVDWESTVLKATILSSDAALIFPYVSADVSTLYATTATNTKGIVIISADAVDWEAAVLKSTIISNDAVGWTATSLKATIISNDASRIFPFVSADVATLKLKTTIISNDAVLQDKKLTILSSDAVNWNITQKNVIFIEPDQIATVTADVLMFPVDAYNYPTGITVLKVGLAASAATTCSYALEEWTTSDWTTASITSIDVVYLTASAESTDTGITDASVAAGSWVVVGIDNVNINQSNVTIWFKKN